MINDEKPGAEFFRPTLREIVQRKLTDVLVPGLAVPFSPEEAEYAGAFIEDAVGDDDIDDTPAKV